MSGMLRFTLFEGDVSAMHYHKIFLDFMLLGNRNCSFCYPIAQGFKLQRVCKILTEIN